MLTKLVSLHCPVVDQLLLFSLLRQECIEAKTSVCKDSSKEHIVTELSPVGQN